MDIIIKADEEREFNPLTLRFEDQDNFKHFQEMLEWVMEYSNEFYQIAADLLEEINLKHS